MWYNEGDEGLFVALWGSFVLQNVIPCVVRIEFRLYALGIRQVVRHWVLVPAFGGSNPSSPARENTSAFAGVFSVMIQIGIGGRWFVVERSEIELVLL